QYGSNGNLSELLWMPAGQGHWNLTYVERTDLGDFGTEVVLAHLNNEFFLDGGSRLANTQNSIGYTGQLLFDSLGRPHVVFVGNVLSCFLEHFTRDGSGWHQSETVNDLPGTGVLIVSAAIGADNSLHIALEVTGPSFAFGNETLIYGT